MFLETSTLKSKRVNDFEAVPTAFPILLHEKNTKCGNAAVDREFSSGKNLSISDHLFAYFRISLRCLFTVSLVAVDN